MKKKICILIVAIVTLVSMFALTACNDGSEEEGGATQNVGYTIAKDYPNYINALESLVANGVNVKYLVVSSEGEYEVNFAAKNDIVYVEYGQTNQTFYLDLSQEENYDYYTYDAKNDSWEVDTFAYGANEDCYASKEDAVSEILESINYVLILTTSVKDIALSKTTSTYAGRSADKYTGVVGETSDKGDITVTIYMDKETGVVLYSETSGEEITTYSCSYLRVGTEVKLKLPKA